MTTPKMNRRRFIQGMGGLTLALPFLPSLFPRQANGADLGIPKRFVAVANFDGYYESMYYPKVDADKMFAPDVYYKALSEIPVTSELFSTILDPFKSKMNIYRGLDIPGSYGHSAANMLCGCAREIFGDNNPIDPVGTGQSIDVVLGKAKSFYPTLPKYLALRGQEPSYNYSVSFDKDAANKTVRIPYMTTAESMFQQTFGSLITDPKTQDDFRNKKVKLGDLLLADFNRIKNGRRIGAEDKVTLSNFVDRLHDLNTRLNIPDITCSSPQLRKISSPYWDLMTETDRENIFNNYMDVMVTAMACDLTRVSVLSMRIFGHDHGLSHASTTDRGNQLQYIANTQKILKVVSGFASRMNSVIEADGKSMLDHSILFWGNEDSNGGPHSCISMPAMTIGSAGGNIKTGYYVDYRQRPFYREPNGQNLGRSYTQLLVTIMKALGLQPNEYLQYGDGGGFGSFNRDAAYSNKLYYPYEKFRNDPLPFIGQV